MKNVLFRFLSRSNFLGVPLTVAAWAFASSLLRLNTTSVPLSCSFRTTNCHWFKEGVSICTTASYQFNLTLAASMIISCCLASSNSLVVARCILEDSWDYGTEVLLDIYITKWNPFSTLGTFKKESESLMKPIDSQISPTKLLFLGLNQIGYITVIWVSKIKEWVPLSINRSVAAILVCTSTGSNP